MHPGHLGSNMLSDRPPLEPGTHRSADRLTPYPPRALPVLYLFGRELPAALGTRSFLALYFGGALTASSAWLVQQQSLLARSRYQVNSSALCHYLLLTPTHYDSLLLTTHYSLYLPSYQANSSALYHTASLGASGPVNAVILCSCLLAPRRTLLLFFVLPMPAGVLAALFLANDVYGMLQGPQSSKIAHSAHLGGALFGAVWVGLRLFLR